MSCLLAVGSNSVPRSDTSLSLTWTTSILVISAAIRVIVGRTHPLTQLEKLSPCYEDDHQGLSRCRSRRRRARDSNPEVLTDASFQDWCNSRSANPPTLTQNN